MTRDTWVDGPYAGQTLDQTGYCDRIDLRIAVPDHRPICVRKHRALGWYWHCYDCVGGDWSDEWTVAAHAAHGHAAYHQRQHWYPGQVSTGWERAWLTQGQAGPTAEQG